MKRSLVLAVSAALAVTPVVAQENVVNVYNWSDYIAEDTIAKFEAETGIKVNYDVFDSNEIVEAKLLAGNSGYDVVVPSGFFLQRQIAAGIFQPLDKSKLPNLANMDPVIMKATEAYDPGNQYAVDYMWSTTGLGYNIDALAERLPGVEATSWDLLFKPENAEKLAECGIALLDAPAEVVSTALNYLGLDPNSEKEEDLAKAEELLTSIRPYVRYFHSSQYISDLANGDICLAMGYSGDVFIARDRADEAGQGVKVDYFIPSEGAIISFDMMAIPSDAPHVENAHKFINFIMEPQIAADITNYVWYASGNAAATEFVIDEVRNNPAVFPPDEVKAKLFAPQAHTPQFDRLLTRAWTRIKTGQ